MPKTLPDLFKGKLVRLAAPQPEDPEAFARWSQDASYLRQLDTAHAQPTLVAEMLERQNSFRADPCCVLFHLRTLEDDRLIGFLAIHSIEWNNQAGILSMGIGDPAYQGSGYGTDALNLGLNYAFNELNLFRVGLDVIASNTRAIHTYEKAGFKHEGARRSAVYRDGQRVDWLLMGILRSEWEEGNMDNEPHADQK